jgi:hypothetical protein
MKRSTSADELVPPLESPRCIIALVSGDEGYDIIMDMINDEDSVCSST